MGATADHTIAITLFTTFLGIYMQSNNGESISIISQITGREDVFMGKVKVVSKNNQVSVKVKSTKDEQLNQNMAELLSNTAVEGVLPFHIVSDNNGFTAEYGTAGYETAKEFFKNRVIDQHTFSVFMKSSVNALSGMSAYNMEYGNVMVSLDTVFIESATGKALYLYYQATGYNNAEY